MSKKILAAAISMLMGAAYAAPTYFVVVPLQLKAAASTINVSLESAATSTAIVGVPFSLNLASRLLVTGDSSFTGTGVTWSVVSSSLPAGLGLTADGFLAGTPTTEGSGAITVRASYKNAKGEQTYQVVSVAVVVSLATGTPPQALVGQPYSYSLKPLLSVTGDNAYDGSGVSWSVVSSTLPAGLYLTNDGFIGGTPTASGSGSITARATYKGVNGQQTYQVVTLGINVSLAAATPPQAIVGQAYSYDLTKQLSVTGDNAYNGSGVTWSVVSSTLPAGLYLTNDGYIGGTPTASGSGSITARATYKGVNGQQTYSVVTLNISVSLAAATPPQAIVGQAYSYDLTQQLSVTGDNAYNGSGVTWSVVSSTLPAGLYLTNDGYIGGTPTASGSGSITARATYKGVNGQQTYQVVTLGINVSLAAATPPQAIVGQAYSYDLTKQLSVTGDNAYNGSGVTWSVVSNSLPAGLYLTSDGFIGGTPTASGSGSITARATYKGVNGQQTYQVVTLGINVSLAAATPPQAIVGQAYSYDLTQQLSVTGDNAYNGSGVTWSVVSSTLPAGLYLTNDGFIGGTPTASGSGSITARATYKGVNGQQTYQVVTLGINVSLAAATPPQAIVGQAYSYDLTQQLSVTGDNAYNGTGVTWSVVSSTLPAGLYLTADGFIGGTPTASGSGSITARATYKGVNGQQTYSVVTLNISVSLAAATPPDAVMGQAYSYNLKPLLSVTGDNAYNGTGVTWSVVSSTLPAGLYLTSDGYIGGTPTASGSGSITARATYRGANGQQTYALVSRNITVSLASATLPDAKVNQAYSYDFKPLLTVSGDPSYTGSGVTWQLVSGSVPAGLSFSSGQLSGTPTTAGNSTFSLQAMYRNIASTQAYALTTNSGSFQYTATLSSNTSNYNLYNAAVAAGWNTTTPLVANVTIATGVVVSSTSPSTAAFATGSGFPAGSALTVTNNGTIAGAGGVGGKGGTANNATISAATNGGSGGTGLQAQYSVTVANNGTIGGGGGGGGGGAGMARSGYVGYPSNSFAYSVGGSGGGGASSNGAAGAGGGATNTSSNLQTGACPGNNGNNGGSTSAGAGGAGVPCGVITGGAGGAAGGLGFAGTAGTLGSVTTASPGASTNGTVGAGGSAGAAVTGNANITWSATGTRLGAVQ